MKKVLAILLILTVVLSSVFAVTTEEDKNKMVEDYLKTPSAYSFTQKPFVPTNAKMLGMGGAGVALNDSSYGLFVNPATIGNGEFNLSLPSVNVTLYHTYDMLQKDSEGKTFFDKIQNTEEVGDILNSAIDIVGSQFTPLLSFDADASIVLPYGLALGVLVKDTVYTYSGSVIDEANVSAALGFGQTFDLGYGFKVGLGGNIKLNAIAFNQRLKAADLTGDESSSIQTNIATGYAIPFDIGARVEWNGLSMAVVAQNINSNYKMDILHYDSADETIDYENLEFGKYEIKQDGVISVGVAYENDYIRIAADNTDVVGMLNELKDTTDKKRVVINHLNAGLEVSLLNIAYLRGGISSGYWTAGASFNLAVFRVDCAYYWKELGSRAGQRPVDGLTLRFNLGWE